MFTFLLLILCYRRPKIEKLIKATLNGTIYMNELEMKSQNMIVCIIVFNYILTVISILIGIECRRFKSLIMV